MGYGARTENEKILGDDTTNASRRTKKMGRAIQQPTTRAMANGERYVLLYLNNY